MYWHRSTYIGALLSRIVWPLSEYCASAFICPWGIIEKVLSFLNSENWNNLIQRNGTPPYKATYISLKTGKALGSKYYVQ
jgi:hypothetical protein